MKQYLKITNQGLICEEDLMLIGSSTKREDDTKIGMFGSGWKYALAWLIRNDCTPSIFAGQTAIEVDYRASLHRNNPVRIITVNGKDTSLTAEMGPQWTGWMAVREIVSNAIDEGNYQITTEFNPELAGVVDTTTVYVPMVKELRDMMMSYDRYFGFDREAAVTNDKGSIYLRTELSEQTIYRKGIRCYDSEHRTYLDYNFTDISINESRLASSWDVKTKMRNLIASGNMTAPVLKAFILDAKGDDDKFPGLNREISDLLIELAIAGSVFTTKSMRNLLGAMAGIQDALIVSNDWYGELVRLGYAKSMLSFLDGTDIPFIQTHNKDTSMIEHYLTKFNVNLDVISGIFESYDQVLVLPTKVVVHEKCRADDKQIAAEALGKMKASSWLALLQ